MTQPVPVRQLSPGEVHIAIDWARQEGWNPGVYDAALFYAADPDGFLVALHDEEPAAVISMVRYSPSFAFLGFYICRPDLRGRGYGMRVWNAAIAQAGTRVIGLDGVPEQQGNYVRSGFQLAWRNRRYRGIAGRNVRFLDADVVDLDVIAFDQIAAYDSDVFEADRRRFLRFWIAQPDATRLGVVRNGRLVGWGLLRRCHEGHKIGPLMADDADIAERLLDGLMATAPGEAVYLDVPEPNAAAIRAAESRGMIPGFETARMYRGTQPQLTLSKIWGITSFELG